MNRHPHFLAVAAVSLMLSSDPIEAQSRPYIAEGYPAEIQAQRELQQRRIYRLGASASARIAPRMVLESARKWRPGRTIAVAFLGGDSSDHEQIASIADEWSRHANITFDWGRDTQGQFRTWTTRDAAFQADIRIAFFTGQLGGYWSLVGTESIDPGVIRPDQPSMNLEGLDQWWPGDAAAVVLHEFGHALGLHHEHQHPEQGCDAEFRWHDDPGYVLTTGAFGDYIPDPTGRRPGLYTYLGGVPNHWPMSEVDFNLKNLSDSRAYVYGDFDSESIMMYTFEPWMFVRGTESYCFTPPNHDLSGEDRRRIAQVYPEDASDVQALSLSRQESLNLMIQATPDEDSLRGFLTGRLEEARNLRQ